MSLASVPASVTLVMYLPLQQHYISGITLIARAAGSQRVTSAIRSAVASMDPHLPIVSAQRLDEPAGPIREIYRNDPSTVAPADLETEVLLLIRD